MCQLSHVSFFLIFVIFSYANIFVDGCADQRKLLKN